MGDDGHGLQNVKYCARIELKAEFRHPLVTAYDVIATLALERNLIFFDFLTLTLKTLLDHLCGELLAIFTRQKPKSRWHVGMSSRPAVAALFDSWSTSILVSIALFILLFLFFLKVVCLAFEDGDDQL